MEQRGARMKLNVKDNWKQWYWRRWIWNYMRWTCPVQPNIFTTTNSFIWAFHIRTLLSDCLSVCRIFSSTISHFENFILRFFCFVIRRMSFIHTFVYTLYLRIFWYSKNGLDKHVDRIVGKDDMFHFNSIYLRERMCFCWNKTSILTTKMHQCLLSFITGCGSQREWNETKQNMFSWVYIFWNESHFSSMLQSWENSSSFTSQRSVSFSPLSFSLILWFHVSAWCKHFSYILLCSARDVQPFPQIWFSLSSTYRLSRKCV